MTEARSGATQMFRVSWCTARIPCRCIDCTCMDPTVDNKCYAMGDVPQGKEIPNPRALMDYCPFYDKARDRKEEPQ
jgi:hypothetical protein